MVYFSERSSRGRDRMVIGFTCAISVYYHKRCEYESRSRQGVLDTTSCDEVFPGFLHQ
jgi:hypothetical protein